MSVTRIRASRLVWTLGFLLFAGACFILSYALLAGQQEGARFKPPVVLIGDPPAGTAILAGGVVPVSVTVYGESPITSVELWMDGNLIETQGSPSPEGLDPFFAQFFIPLPPGEHAFSALAVDSRGVVGKSVAVGILGRPLTEEDEMFVIVPVEDGDTLETIATAHQTDPAALQNLNPGLEGGQPAPGTAIMAPVPKEAGAPPSPPVAANLPLQVPNSPMLSAASFLQVVFEPITVQISLLSGSPPSPGPGSLQGEVKDCEVTLRWDDFSSNELRYEVWTAWMGLEPRVVASLVASPKSGPAWYRFFAPQTGKVPFWVEAVTPAGNQPSNDAMLNIPQNCAATQGGGKYLIVQVYDLTTTKGYDRVYCYASIESLPEARIPSVIGEFVTVKNGRASFGGEQTGLDAPGPNEKLVPVPADGALDIEGKCLGWQGGALSTLGHFSGKFTSQDWDGARRLAQGEGFTIEMAVKPFNAAVSWAMNGKFGYEDPSLKAPYDLKIDRLRAPSGQKMDPRERELTWKWTGDPKRISGFQVYLNGSPYKFVSGAQARSATVMEPTYCGHPIRWTVVAAASPLAQSPASQPLAYDQPACQTYAMVVFKDINLLRTDDDDLPWPFVTFRQCDTLEFHYTLSANEVFKSFGFMPSFASGCLNCLIETDCGHKSFYAMGQFFHPGDAHPEKLVLPIYADPTGLFEIVVRARFWEHDHLSANEKFGFHEYTHTFLSLKHAQDVLGCGKEYIGENDTGDHDTAVTWLTYELVIFPNACQDFPAGIPLPVPPWGQK